MAWTRLDSFRAPPPALGSRGTPVAAGHVASASAIASALVVAVAALLLVSQLVLKVLRVAKQKGLVVVPKAIQNPKPARERERERERERGRERGREESECQ